MFLLSFVISFVVLYFINVLLGSVLDLTDKNEWILDYFELGDKIRANEKLKEELTTKLAEKLAEKIQEQDS